MIVGVYLETEMLKIDTQHGQPAQMKKKFALSRVRNIYMSRCPYK